MKAAVCTAHGKPLSLETITLNPPAENEVRVKLSACAICHSDIAYMDGAWSGDLPAVFGHEASGYVEAVGPGVETFACGDPVIATLVRSCGTCHYCNKSAPVLCETTFPLDTHSPIVRENGQALTAGMRTGAFAEYIVVHQSQLVSIPQDMPMDCAALIACGVLTGVGAVVRSADLQKGDTMGVIGTGGVGLNSVQGGVLAGATTIVALDICDDKLSAAKNFGATHTCNPKDTDAAQYCQSITEGRGLDAVFVSVGSARAVEQALTLVKKGGLVMVIGMPPEGDFAQIDPSILASNSIKLIGSKMGDTIITEDIPWLITQFQSGKLKLNELISHRFPFSEINEAIATTRQPNARRVVLLF